MMQMFENFSKWSTSSSIAYYLRMTKNLLRYAGNFLQEMRKAQRRLHEVEVRILVDEIFQ